MATLGQSPAIDGRALYAKISWRLIPYMFLLYILAYLDRVNVGFAAAQMKADLHFSDSVYGFGAGIFFLGSSVFDLPSNLLLQRVGPRKWIARIMISWGIVATSMMLVRTPISFYCLRFLLGIAEAGFFPGMIFYLTYWFPSRERARAVARFMTATAIAGVIGGPLSSFLLKLNGHGGLAGWQWLFLSEGLPTIVFGFTVLFLLRDTPDQAGWLKPEEKEWLDSELERDRRAQSSAGHTHLLDALKLPQLWVLAGIFFVTQVCMYTINLWMPLILGALSGIGGDAAVAQSSSLVSRYATVPYIAAAVLMVVIGWSSDRIEERRWHIAGCMLLSAIGFAWAANAHSVLAAIAAFSVASVGVWSMMGPFWTYMTGMLEGTAAAGGIAIITTIGGLGGFLGPFMTGRLRDLTHSFSGGLYAAAALTFCAALLSLAARKGKAAR
jgi:ACS family tartrate transporter-like MFS transporter